MIWKLLGIAGILFLIFIAFLLYCCIRVGAEADERMKALEQKEEESL